jgi:dolichol-phosphate mannosyltransferase
VTNISEIDISIVSPVYGCAPCLSELVNRLSETFDDYGSLEIILVCDRSPDDSWEVIRELANSDDRITGLLLAKNVGQHQAVSAGLDHATGRTTVVLDCDLQDRPEDALSLVRAIESGGHIAIGESAFRGKESPGRTTARKLYFRLLDFLDGPSSADRNRNHSFFALSTTARLAVCSYRERVRQLSVILRDVGFEPVYIPVTHRSRRKGPSSYSTLDRLNLGLEGLLLHGSRVLKYLILVSFVLFLATVSIAAVFFTRRLFGWSALPGWFSTIQLLLLLTSVQLLGLGVTGLYLHSILVELRQRPIYIIAETTDRESGL